jgi:hypothetical protein
MMQAARANAGRVWMPVLGIAVAWAILYRLNDVWAETLAWSDGVTWLFLPAAVRPLAILLFGVRGAAGLFLGSLLTMSLFTDAPVERVVSVAAISALAPLIAVTCVVRCLALRHHLRGLTTLHLIIIVVASSALSVALHNVYYWNANFHADLYSGMLPMLVGDLLGTFIVLYFARSALRVHARLRRERRR